MCTGLYTEIEIWLFYGIDDILGKGSFRGIVLAQLDEGWGKSFSLLLSTKRCILFITYKFTPIRHRVI